VKVVVADLKALSRRLIGEMRTSKNTQATIVAVLVEYFNLQPVERFKRFTA
jgi:K+/H+ antiporter YhaU regulatory subunit KhtT